MTVRIIEKNEDIITISDLINDIKKSSKIDNSGTIFTFEGIVRGNEPGKKVDKLILTTSDKEKTKNDIENIIEEIKLKYGVYEINVVHYIGEFYTGDSLFLVAILGAHRDESYDALKNTIERVKFEVDFKKKEISNKGSKTILAGG
ncbi:molybdenum cofactor biosynthesis protein MoaE [uncultured Methanobrevibacter sp.]|uniref:molybdenum cofactor biosynthesis protein MoaE n=1 Tax=uncultured Methanobrevibacter sp. TaxID=253161 RepID=UPI0025F60856|nr:molybdenum cofactor biosynthesis protein MoaE [uncultured Methanobrevibacter sp.]